MNNPKTLSYIAIAISVVALATCLLCCGKCHSKKFGPRHGDHGRPEMMAQKHHDGMRHHERAPHQPEHQPQAQEN